MLKIENIRKVFNPGTINEKVALDGVDLTLEEGEFVTVIGGNGAGKSTTLNAVAGVWPVDSGKIYIGGEDVTKLSEEEKALIREQTEMYHTYQLLIRNGDYYRLASYAENHYYDAYMVVSKDQKEALMTFVQVLAEPNRRSRKVHLQGLDPEAVYYCDVTQREYTGEILMKGGLLIGDLWGDAVSRLYHFEKR